MSERDGFAGLDPCVHCGFCLPACPTYLATGDENDSPRGRIVLMRAVEQGELKPSDPAVRRHLDACLGCRGCEPVCPSGVAYGRGLEAARERLATANGVAQTTRAFLRLLERPMLAHAAFGSGRVLRGLRLAGALAGPGQVGFALGMLAATRPAQRIRGRPGIPTERSAVLFRGCVMGALFDHVHRATVRTLGVNGSSVSPVAGQVCCGAPHAHAGDGAAARRLAERNVQAFAGRADPVVVNSAGCGAMLREYGHLLGTEAARNLSARVRDVSEVLAEAGPRPGAPVAQTVAYEPPCHLQHAQGIHDSVLAVLAAIPETQVHLAPGAERCCGGAGLYGLTHREMAEAVLTPKIDALSALGPDVVATGNPGCHMQIGAGLRARHLPIPVAHPVELLDWSYHKAGLYTASQA